MIIHLSDYQHLFQEDDATLAVQEALYVCRKHPGSILKLGGGQLHFHPYSNGKIDKLIKIILLAFFINKSLFMTFMIK